MISIQQRNDYNQRKRKRRLSAKVKLFWFVCFVGGLFVCALFICQTATISVIGNDVYTKQEIIAASGIEKGDNLLFISSDNSEKDIYSKLSYIEQAAVRKQFPNQIKIEVIESKQNVDVVTNEGVITVSKRMKVLADVSNDQNENIVVLGLNPTEYVIGETLVDQDPEKVMHLVTIFDILDQNNAVSEITEIDISDKLNILINYQDRISILLGTAGDAEYKLLIALETLQNNIDASKTGSLDISIAGRAFFSETVYVEPTPEPQQEPEEQQEQDEPEQ